MASYTNNVKRWWPAAGWAESVRARVVRLFFREPSSPWLPVLLYGPVAVACILWGLVGEPAPTWALLVLPPVGFLVWTLAEYVLHSTAFHNPSGTPVLRAVQASHLSHHDDPQDPNLIVARLSTSLSLAVLFFLLFWFALRDLKLAALLMSGLIVGYLGYEVVHFAIHRSRRWRWLLRPMIRHHLYHHHKDSTRCYGVTTPLWDWVFRTGRQPNVAQSPDTSQPLR
jgi:sterol desaturase/sphingolipid hydroxylase (fatty acid hydroxylase superfamily)